MADVSIIINAMDGQSNLMVLDRANKDKKVPAFPLYVQYTVVYNQLFLCISNS